ncbi:MAG: nucleotidyltransferase domain-containing protein [bacterium]|nr:nucleotidyltransferase domain-containing protein [bacterium]
MVEFNEEKLKEMAEKYSLADVYLFGSRISGFAREDSDLDIGIRFKNGLPKEEERGKLYGNIFSDLSSCFAEAKIDLVFIDEVLLHFQYKIINDGQLIYSKNKENSMNFEEKIANYYRDYKYFIDEYFKGVLAFSAK